MRRAAAELDISAGQLALAWVYAQAERLGICTVAIPGTKRPKRVDENATALDVDLDNHTLDILAPLADMARGDRYGMR